MKYKFRAFNKQISSMIYLDPLQWPLKALEDSNDWKVMMWTGLLDRQGKEIYEGDIVRHIPSAFDRKDIEGEVFWFQGHCRFALGRPNGHFLDSLNNYEVIDNIYENPELSKEAKCQN